MKVSVLGSGWLGLPLAIDLINCGHDVNLSTTSHRRLDELNRTKARAFIVDIHRFSDDISDFLVVDTLIINITSKCIESYIQLISKIEKSTIKQVLFISSTSVYKAVDQLVSEQDALEEPESSLYQIEQLFRLNRHFQTTVLRLSGLVGYSHHPGRFFQNGKTVQQPDAGVNLIHRDDCLGIIKQIITQSAWGEVFNACATSHPSKRQFYTYARQLLNLAAPVFNEATANQRNKIVSNNKVISQLSYDFIYPDLMATPFLD